MTSLGLDEESTMGALAFKTELLNVMASCLMREPPFEAADAPVEKESLDAPNNVSPQQAADVTTVRRIRALVHYICAVDGEFVLKLALYCRHELHLRSSSNFLVALCAREARCADFLLPYMEKIILLPSDWLSIANFAYFHDSDAAHRFASASRGHSPTAAAPPSAANELGNGCAHGDAECHDTESDTQAGSSSHSLTAKLPSVLRRALVSCFKNFSEFALAKYNNESAEKAARQKRKQSQAKENSGQGIATAESAASAHQRKRTFTYKQLIRLLHIAEPAYEVCCILGRRYPATENEFRRLGLHVNVCARRGEERPFDPSRCGARMRLSIPVTWETQLSERGNTGQVWDELVATDAVPYMALLRNVRNILTRKCSESTHLKVLEKLTAEDQVANCQQLPYRFYSSYAALKEVEQLILSAQILEREIASLKAGLRGQRGTVEAARKIRIKEDQLRKLVEQPMSRHLPASMVTLLPRYQRAVNKAIGLSARLNIIPVRGTSIVLLCLNSWLLNPMSAMKGGTPGTATESRRSKLDAMALLAVMMMRCCERCIVVLYCLDEYKVFKEVYDEPVENLTQPRPLLDVVDDLLCAAKNLITRKSPRVESSFSIFDPSSKAQFPYAFLDEVVERRVRVESFVLLDEGAHRTYETINHDAPSLGDLPAYLSRMRRAASPDMLYVGVNIKASPIPPELRSVVDPQVACPSPIYLQSRFSHRNDVLLTGFSDSILRLVAERTAGGTLGVVERANVTYNVSRFSARSLELARMAQRKALRLLRESQSRKVAEAAAAQQALEVSQGERHRWRLAEVERAATVAGPAQLSQSAAAQPHPFGGLSYQEGIYLPSFSADGQVKFLHEELNATVRDNVARSEREMQKLMSIHARSSAVGGGAGSLALPSIRTLLGRNGMARNAAADEPVPETMETGGLTPAKESRVSEGHAGVSHPTPFISLIKLAQPRHARRREKGTEASPPSSPVVARRVLSSYRVCRFFISSTFLDMSNERNAITLDVFPRLRKWAAQQGFKVHLLEVDLRWGIPEVATTKNLSTSVCLNEVSRCSPFFIGILGARYGSCPPLPLHVVVDEDVDARDYDWLQTLQNPRVSVTELEMRHAIFNVERRLVPGEMSGALFFSRSSDGLLASFGDGEESRRAVYCPDSPASEAAIAKLRHYIEEEGYTITSYTAHAKPIGAFSKIGPSFGVLDAGDQLTNDDLARLMAHNSALKPTGGPNSTLGLSLCPDKLPGTARTAKLTSQDVALEMEDFETKLFSALQSVVSRVCAVWSNTPVVPAAEHVGESYENVSRGVREARAQAAAGIVTVAANQQTFFKRRQETAYYMERLQRTYAPPRDVVEQVLSFALNGATPPSDSAPANEKEKCCDAPDTNFAGDGNKTATEKSIGASETARGAALFSGEELPSIMLVTGGNGEGKSSLLASVAAQLLNDGNTCKAAKLSSLHIVYCPLQAGECTMRSLLYTLATEIMVSFQLFGVVHLQEGDSAEQLMQGLEELYQIIVQRAGTMEREAAVQLVVLLDGLDQCIDARDLVTHLGDIVHPMVQRCVRFVVTTNEEHGVATALLSRKPSPVVLPLPPLEESERGLLVRLHLADVGKQLEESISVDELKRLLRKKDAAHPSYLTAAITYLRLFSTFDSLREDIRELPGSLAPLYGAFFRELGHRFDPSTCQLVLTILFLRQAAGGIMEYNLYRLVSNVADASRLVTLLVGTCLRLHNGRLRIRTNAFAVAIQATYMPFPSDIHNAYQRMLVAELYYRPMDLTYNLQDKLSLLNMTDSIKKHSTNSTSAMLFFPERHAPQELLGILQSSVQAAQLDLTCALVRFLPFLECLLRDPRNLQHLLEVLSLATHASAGTFGHAASEVGIRGPRYHKELAKLKEVTTFLQVHFHILALRPDLLRQCVLNTNAEVPLISEDSVDQWICRHGECTSGAKRGEGEEGLRSAAAHSALAASARWVRWQNRAQHGGQERLQLFEPSQHEVLSMALSGDASTVALGCGDGYVRIAAVAEANTLIASLKHAGEVRALTFASLTGNVRSSTGVRFGGGQTPDGLEVLISGCSAGLLYVWSVKDNALLQVGSGHLRAVTGLSYHPHTQVLSSSGLDGYVMLWNVLGVASQLSTSLSAKDEDSAGKDFAQQNGGLHPKLKKKAVSLLGKKTEGLSLSPFRVERQHESPVSCVAFHKSGTVLGSGSWDGIVVVRNMEPAAVGESRRKGVKRALTGDSDAVFESFSLQMGSPVRVMAFSPSMAATCAVGCYSGTVALIDVASRSTTASFAGLHHSPVSSLCFSLDGRLLASAETSGSIRLTHAGVTGTLFGLLNGHEGSVTGLVFRERDPGEAAGSPMTELLSTGLDHTLQIWRLGGGLSSMEGDRLLSSHAAAVTAVGVADDGSFLVTGAADGTATVFTRPAVSESDGPLCHQTSMAAGAMAPWFRLAHDGCRVSCIRVAMKNTRILVGVAFGFVYIWSAKPGLNRAQGHLIGRVHVPSHGLYPVVSLHVVEAVTQETKLLGHHLPDAEQENDDDEATKRMHSWMKPQERTNKKTSYLAAVCANGENVRLPLRDSATSLVMFSAAEHDFLSRSGVIPKGHSTLGVVRGGKGSVETAVAEAMIRRQSLDAGAKKVRHLLARCADEEAAFKRQYALSPRRDRLAWMSRSTMQHLCEGEETSEELTECAEDTGVPFLRRMPTALHGTGASPLPRMEQFRQGTPVGDEIISVVWLPCHTSLLTGDFEDLNPIMPALLVSRNCLFLAVFSSAGDLACGPVDAEMSEPATPIAAAFPESRTHLLLADDEYFVGVSRLLQLAEDKPEFLIALSTSAGEAKLVHIGQSSMNGTAPQLVLPADRGEAAACGCEESVTEDARVVALMHHLWQHTTVAVSARLTRAPPPLRASTDPNTPAPHAAERAPNTPNVAPAKRLKASCVELDFYVHNNVTYLCLLVGSTDGVTRLLVYSSPLPSLADHLGHFRCTAQGFVELGRYDASGQLSTISAFIPSPTKEEPTSEENDWQRKSRCRITFKRAEGERTMLLRQVQRCQWFVGDVLGNVYQLHLEGEGSDGAATASENECQSPLEVPGLPACAPSAANIAGGGIQSVFLPFTHGHDALFPAVHAFETPAEISLRKMAQMAKSGRMLERLYDNAAQQCETKPLSSSLTLNSSGRPDSASGILPALPTIRESAATGTDLGELDGWLKRAPAPLPSYATSPSFYAKGAPAPQLAALPSKFMTESLEQYFATPLSEILSVCKQDSCWLEELASESHMAQEIEAKLEKFDGAGLSEGEHQKSASSSFFSILHESRPPTDVGCSAEQRKKWWRRRQDVLKEALRVQHYNKEAKVALDAYNRSIALGSA